MDFQVEYRGEQLFLPDIECDCGLPHNKPDMDIYIGNGIVENSGTYIKKRNMGKNALVVTDNIILDVAARQVIDILKREGFAVKLCTLEREEELVPDETAIGEVLLSMEEKINFLVAVGSGSINDITRYVAFHTDRSFVSIGTAPSMDGYTSVIAPLINNNLKVNKPAINPEVLICDLDIMKKAPYQMLISGFGDVAGKYIAIADWILGRFINGESYCPVNVEIVFQAVEKCMANVEQIKQRSNKGIKSLIEALILAGVTILILDNTRAVSSIEHAMGHYLEMMKLIQGEKPARHGITVGVTTGYVIKFYEEFFKFDFSSVDKKEIKKSKKTKKQWRKEVLEKYGKKIGTLVLKDNPAGYTVWEQQERRIDSFFTNFAQIKEELDFLPDWQDLKGVYQQLSLPLSAGEISVKQDMLQDSLIYAKDYRERYTLFKTADELGILENMVGRVMDES